jgi:hypothetical protein
MPTPGAKTLVVELVSAIGASAPTQGLCFWVDDVVLTRNP